MSKDSRGAITKGKDVCEELKKISTAAFRGRSIPVAVLLVLVALLSLGSGLYAGASFFPQQAPNVTITTTIFTTTTSLTTSTTWSTVTSVVYGVWTTVQYTTSTSTVTLTGGTTYRTTKIVTANGNAHINTAQSKFGGASGLFGGSGDYLSTPDSADWYFGSGDFTIDFWARFNALPTSGQQITLCSQKVDNANRVMLNIYNNAGTYEIYYDVSSRGTGINYPTGKQTISLATNTWYHIAWARSGNNWYLFKDGTQLGSPLSSTTVIPDFAASMTIGGYPGVTAWSFNGWLDEFRISKGVARWTSNFTPPTGPYTNDSNTVLLLHMDGADGSTIFIDG